MEKHLTTRNLIILTFACSCSYYLYLVLKADFLFIQYDAYYYSAVADSYIDNGNWLNRITIPPSNLRTPQNGIIVINAIFKTIGLNNHELRLGSLALMNTFIICAITFLCYRILALTGIPHSTSWIISFSVPISFYYQMVLLQPTNDAIFVLLSYITLLFIFTHQKLTKNDIIILLVLATIVPFFRMAGMALFIAPALVYMLNKQYRYALLFLIFSIWSFISPFVSNYILGFDIADIQSRGSEIIGSYNLEFFLQHIYNTITLNLPEALLRITYFTSGFTIPNAIFGSIISTIIIVLFFFKSKEAFVDKNLPILILAVYVLINFALFQTHPAQPTRYLIVLSPLLPLVFFLKAYTTQYNKIASAILFITIIISIFGLVSSDKNIIGEKKRGFSEIAQAQLSDLNYELVSYFPRTSYFLLNKSAAKNLAFALKNDPDWLVSIGPESYQKTILDDMNSTNITYKTRLIPSSYLDYAISENPKFGFKYKQIEVYAILFKLTSNQP